MPKLGSSGKVHVTIITRGSKRKDGYRMVQEVHKVYDPAIQNNRVIKSKTLGYLPPDVDDVSMVVPKPPSTQAQKSDDQPQGTEGRDQSTVPTPEQPQSLEQATAQSMATNAAVVQDTRMPGLVKYPLDLVLLVIVLAGLAGFTSCRQIAEYWKLHRLGLSVWFDHFPDRDISHDTVRNVIKILGKGDVNQLIKQFTAPLVEMFKQRVVALDGQAVRAASSEEHKKHSRYVLNVYDTDNELCLQQVLIEEKKNEITEAINVVKSLDLNGAVVTCDAMNTQRKFAQFLIEKKRCDYCFAVKCNHEELHTHVKGWFETRQGQEEAKCHFREENGHGRFEEREIRVLPASLMKTYTQDILDKWVGLEDGCLVMARTKRTFKDDPTKDSDEVRYFITSLNFDRAHIAPTLARVIRRHWMVENSLHWVLDVTFGQDRTQCRNGDFLAGKTALNKLIFNLMSKVQSIEEEKTGRQAPHKPSIKVRLSTPKAAMSVLSEFIESWDSMK